MTVSDIRIAKPWANFPFSLPEMLAEVIM